MSRVYRDGGFYVSASGEPVCQIHAELGKVCVFCRLDTLRRRRSNGDFSVNTEYDRLIAEVLNRECLE